MTVRFCSRHETGAGAEALVTQPAEQLERMRNFALNRSFFSCDWKADLRLCGRNVTSYFVAVESSSTVVNWALMLFGGFPQSTCSADSKAVNAVVTQDGKTPTSCSPYGKRCHEQDRVSSFAIPGAW